VHEERITAPDAPADRAGAHPILGFAAGSLQVLRALTSGPSHLDPRGFSCELARSTMPNEEQYEQDVFISYRRDTNAAEWLRLYLHPRLKQWLKEELGREPVIYVDWEMETGTIWPEKLRRALLRSRCLLPIFSPPYFTSNWCLAELHSFLARHQQLGMGMVDAPDGLIFPVIFSDGDSFPPEAGQIQVQRDRADFGFLRLNNPDPMFGQTPRSPELTEKIGLVAADLKKMIGRAPAWRDDFPVVLPSPSGTLVLVEQPRLV
jgi:hypothetical protein